MVVIIHLRNPSTSLDGQTSLQGDPRGGHQYALVYGGVNCLAAASARSAWTGSERSWVEERGLSTESMACIYSAAM